MIDAKPYLVRVFDNFHYGDVDEAYDEGSYATYEETFAAAQAVLRRSLEHLHKPGMSAADLCALNSLHGEDPAIIGPEGTPHYSSREECAALAAEVFRARGG